MKPDPICDPAVAAVVEQLKTMLPDMPARDHLPFAISLTATGPYRLGPESEPIEGVPRGLVVARKLTAGAIYPHVAHDYSVYVPCQYDGTVPACLMVFQDGARYLGAEVNAATVFDNLIHRGSMPVTIAVFVQPGAAGPGLPLYGGVDNRSVEYDSLGDHYARFLIEELLPDATRDLDVTDAPGGRAICGLSSGGICSFNVAWERPDVFGKVVSHCGSFVNIRGGHELAYSVRRAEPKPLRVFLQSGSQDLNIIFGDWVNGNRAMAASLAYRGYEHCLIIGKGGHSLAHGGSIFPETMRWLWRSEGANTVSKTTNEFEGIS